MSIIKEIEMSFFTGLKSIFGIKSAPKASEAIEYNGFTIIPAPIPERGQYRIAGTITKGEGDNIQIHNFTRSDRLNSRTESIEMTIQKAMLTIDQLEDRIFN